ncbi:MAG: hypothetical protein B6U89_05600, partial [Desulfurococcales archaeon ex4484_58]
MVSNKLYVVLIFSLLLLQLIVLPSNNSVVDAQNETVPFYVALILHIHQPIYDVSRNICKLVSDTTSTPYQVFYTRKQIYTYYILDLIDYIENNNLPANITIDITGTLIENFENLSICGPSITGLEEYGYILDNWSSRSYNHVEFLSTPYHYILTPMLTRISNESIARELLLDQIQRHSQKLHNLTGKTPGFEGITGYHPPELALDNKSLSLLASLGYNYTIADDLHIYRIFRDYPTPRRTPEVWYTNNEITSRDKTDLIYTIENIANDWIYLSFTYSGTEYSHVMNPYIGLRPHAIETNNGSIVVFPRNRFMSVLLHAIMYFTNDNIDGAVDWFFQIINYLQQYNTDPNRPFILVIDLDGDNGDPYTHQSTWWSFVKRLIENVTTPGSSYSYVKFVSPGWYLKNVYNPINDSTWNYAKLPFIEPGSWNTDNGWGDPYFTKWIYPSKYSNEQKMYNNITRALAYYLNSKNYNPNDPRLNNILYWIGLALQSDWFYYPSTDWYSNSTYAVTRAINISKQITLDDYASPIITFAWYEIPSNNYKPGLLYSDSQPWIKIHVWDTSTLSSVTLKVLVGTQIYTYTMNEETDLPGNYYVQITDPLTPGENVILEFTAIDQNSRSSTLRYVLGRVVDTRYILDGVVDHESRIMWINTTNTVLQMLFVNDTTNYLYIGFNTTTQGSGYDTFLFISIDPSRGSLPHPWTKYGYIPYFDIYVGMEESNGWYGLWMKINGIYDTKDVLIGASWLIDYKWDPINGFFEAIIERRVFSQYYNTDRLFLGIASWGTSDWSSIYEKLKMISTSNSLYKDELIGIYLGDPYLKVYFTPDQGEAALNSLINAIRNAKSYIYIAIYNWVNQSENSLVWRIAEEVVNAKNRGVWIAVVVDGGHLYTDPLDYLRDNGIYVKAESGTGLMHNKFIVIDGVVTFIGSANLVDSAYTVIDTSYQYNDVLEIHSSWFSKPYIYEFIEMRYKGVFHGGDPTPSQLRDQVILLNSTWVRIEYYFQPEEGTDLENAWNNYILSATTSVYVATYILTLNSIGNSLVTAYKNDLDVKVIISYNEKDVSGTEYYKLISNRVPTTLTYDEPLEPGIQILHHKLFIIDREIVATGSTNPTFSGLSSNDENTIIIHWRSLAETYINRFKEIWDKYVAHITIEVYEGDQLAVNAFVNITTYNLSTLTSGTYDWYNYTGYTNASGIYYVEAYLWNPNTTAKFYINASTSNGWNTTIIYLGLNNNTVKVTMRIIVYVKPVIKVTGPTMVYVGRTATYSISVTYPNGTTISATLNIDIYINNTYIETLTLTSGTGSWSYIPSDAEVYNITFVYNGGDRIDGIELLPTSNSTLLKAEWYILGTQLIVTGSSIIYYGEDASYSIELRDKNDNLIEIDTIIEVYVNGSWIENVTLTRGVGSWNFNYSMSGYYNLTFYYPGGDIYNNDKLNTTSTIIYLEIREASTIITIDAPSTAS